MTIPKKSVFICITILLLYAFFELACHLTYLTAQKKNPMIFEHSNFDSISSYHRGIIEKVLAGDSEYLVYDPDLGWSIKANGSKDKYRANSQGIRGDCDYSMTRIFCSPPMLR